MDDQESLMDELEEHLRNPFSEEELRACTLAVSLSMALEYACIVGDHGLIGTARCHEVAHAIGRVLRMDVQQGHVGAFLPKFRGVQHSWLWTKPPPDFNSTHEMLAWTGNILDPWTVGGYPRAQLVSCNLMLGNLGLHYRPTTTGPLEGVEVNFGFVDKLERFFREYIEQHSRRSGT